MISPPPYILDTPSSFKLQGLLDSSLYSSPLKILCNVRNPLEIDVETVRIWPFLFQFKGGGD
ncbi:hypothetical protein WG66_000866 [Moniliophthora roreri]|nr:hypothetical protein WG66_000866 [Moniliophthora roreri]